MRGLAIIIIAFVALSATVRRHPHFMPLPTEQLPAVNVPWLGFTSYVWVHPDEERW